MKKLIILFIILLTMNTQANYYYPSNLQGTTINLPKGSGNGRTAMNWNFKKVKENGHISYQYLLQQQLDLNEDRYFDEDGFGWVRCDDGVNRRAVAVTSTFGHIGDYIDVIMENEEVIHCIIAEWKNKNDINCNDIGHENGNKIIEYLVDFNYWKRVQKIIGYYPIIKYKGTSIYSGYIKQIMNTGHYDF